MRNNQRRTGRARRSSPAPPKQELAFAVPTEFVELPSRGEYYPEDHPLHKQETIEIKFMTTKEEDILSSQALIKKGLAVERFLQSIVGEDIDVSTLLLGDRSAILIAARISGYGSEYNVNINCSSCGAGSELMYNLHDTRIEDKCFDKKYLKKEGVTFNEETQTFDITLPASGVVVGLGLIDGYAERDLKDTKQENETMVTDMLSAIVVKVNDNMDEDYISEFISVMPARDSKHIRKIYPQLVPNVRLISEVICEHCLYKEELEVPLTAEFFWPK